MPLIIQMMGVRHALLLIVAYSVQAVQVREVFPRLRSQIGHRSYIQPAATADSNNITADSNNITADS
jgi:hypothetical protein